MHKTTLNLPDLLNFKLKTRAPKPSNTLRKALVEYLKPPRVVISTYPLNYGIEQKPLIDLDDFDNQASLMTFNMLADVNEWEEQIALYVVPWDFKDYDYVASDKLFIEHEGTQFRSEYYRLLAQITYVYEGYSTPQQSPHWRGNHE